MTVSPTDDHASAERRIQELTRELSRATTELAEARDQQTATGGILRAISNSPSDLQVIFQEIATTAARFCDAHDAGVLQCAGDHLRLVAHRGPNPEPEPELELGQGTLPLSREVVIGRAVLDRTIIQVPDLQAETEEYPEGSEFASRPGHRTVLAVPLIRDREAIGAIFVRRTEVRPFTDRQVELLKTFGDQAVIAIENTRLYEAEQATKRDLTEALEQQTATSEVLSVISSSPGELDAVFQAMLANAVRICEANFGTLHLYDGNKFCPAAKHNTPSALAKFQRERGPFVPERGNPLDRMLQTKRVVHVVDDAAEQVPSPAGRLGGARSLIAVPMLKENELVGAIFVYRQEVRPFTDKQIDLVTNFARQAVIAIENVRLLNELRESLQQQTVTADVLKVISRSALDVQKVLDALVESAARLCNAYDAAIYQVDGSSLRLVAHHGNIPFPAPIGQHKRPLVRGFIAGRAVIERRTNHIADMQAEAEDYAEGREVALRLGWRTGLGVPLLRAGEAIGVILLRRREARPFTDRQIELLKTFADQAVIAIENTRLFEEVQARTKELQDSLDRQTATSEVLGGDFALP